VPSDGYLTRLLKKEHFITVVAMKGKEVVGGLAAYLLALAVTVLSIPHARWAGATRLRSSSRA
jgi:hypothetical protein